jgi:uncharacterized protein YlxW (UPF0749 family)
MKNRHTDPLDTVPEGDLADSGAPVVGGEAVESGESSLEAMAIELPDVANHPNRMPFEGVLFKVGTPSEGAPGGSGGKRVLISKAVAEAATASLLGMGVNVAAGLADHDAQRKVGVITEGFVDGDDYRIRGFIYASDFPKVAEAVKGLQDSLGFSFEAQDWKSKMVGGVRHLTELTFMGAAILKAKAAAYKKTSLKASEEKDVFDMDKDELAKLVAEQVAAATSALQAQATTLQAELATLKAAADEKLEANDKIAKQVEPHAIALEAAADAMEGDGVGTHASRGHAVLARGLAKDMRSQSAAGIFPQIHRDHDWPLRAADADVKTLTAKAVEDATKELSDKLAAAEKAEKDHADKISAYETKIGDLTARVREHSPQPERKTLNPGFMAALDKFKFTRDEAKAGLSDERISNILKEAGANDPAARITAKRQIEKAVEAIQAEAEA